VLAVMDDDRVGAGSQLVLEFPRAACGGASRHVPVAAEVEAAIGTRWPLAYLCQCRMCQVSRWAIENTRPFPDAPGPLAQPARARLDGGAWLLRLR